MSKVHTLRLQLESLEERVVLDAGLLSPVKLNTALTAPLSAATSSTLGAEQILRWNQLALQAIATEKMAPPLAARQLAIVSVTLYDTANGITGQGKNFFITGRGPSMANLDAAVNTAASRVLSSLFPNQKSLFQQQYNLNKAQLPKGVSILIGNAWGASVATRILQSRKSDGATALVTYTASGEVGRWTPTPPGFVQNPLLPQWPYVKPFALSSGDQFRAPAPPALTSQQYAADLNEVKSLGSVNSVTRTADQTQIALFWAAGAGTVTPPGMWNVFAQQLARDNNLGATQTAKLLAVLNVAMADAGIACWDSKYFYDLWRPVTAIRNADLDGNSATEKDPTWLARIGTPPFSSYTSGHSTFSAAAAEVLSAFFGPSTAFSSTSDGLVGVTRSWSSFRAAAVEAGDSRVFGGIHFRFDSVEGINCGIQVGHVALQRFGVAVAS